MPSVRLPMQRCAKYPFDLMARTCYAIIVYCLDHDTCFQPRQLLIPQCLSMNTAISPAMSSWVAPSGHAPVQHKVKHHLESKTKLIPHVDAKQRIFPTLFAELVLEMQ